MNVLAAPNTSTAERYAYNIANVTNICSTVTMLTHDSDSTVHTTPYRSTILSLLMHEYRHILQMHENQQQ